MKNHLTKTEIEILKILTSRLTEAFTIREIAIKINQNYSIVYSAMQNLDKKGYLIKNRHKIFSLNYKENFSVLAYIEFLKAEKFLKNNKEIALFYSEIIGKIDLGLFCLLIFGSYAEGNRTKKSDIDILMIIESSKEAEKVERHLKQIAEKYARFECHVIGTQSVGEVTAKKEVLNVMNETLNKHILLFGAEAYYRLISI